MKVFKSIAKVIATSAILAALVVVPGAVHAQESGVIEVGDGSTTTSASPTPTTDVPSTGATEAAPATPNTGIAPSENKLAQNALVFIGGGAIGVALGYGIITIRKKNLL